MREFLYSLLVLCKKESLMIFKDKRSSLILVMPIILQTLLFGYVASYDLNRVEYALLDEDRSFSSRELVASLDASPIFIRKYTLDNSTQIAGMLDKRKVLLVVHIGSDFERKLNLGQDVPVQAIVDGRNSNVAGIISSYFTVLLDSYSKKRQEERGLWQPSLDLKSRAWFNPNLETRWNIVSGMVAVLAVVQVMALSSLSVAREKEQGTFDQLLVSPLSSKIIMLGKAIPPVCVGLAQSFIVLLIALYWFKIPFGSSVLLLCLGMIIFNFCIVAFGLCISALSASMQEALLYSFSLILPMVLLSGFATPIASMPKFMQYATRLNPARYGVEMAQRIYLEGAGFREMLSLFLPLLFMAFILLILTARLFRKKLS